MLCCDPAKRIAAEEALQDEWIVNFSNKPQLENQNAGQILKNLQTFKVISYFSDFVSVFKASEYALASDLIVHRHAINNQRRKRGSAKDLPSVGFKQRRSSKSRGTDWRLQENPRSYRCREGGGSDPSNRGYQQFRRIGLLRIRGLTLLIGINCFRMKSWSKVFKMFDTVCYIGFLIIVERMGAGL